jgi:cobyrinic acid a,c-diamide synthase
MRLPRLGLATPRDAAEPAPATLALLSGLRRRGWRVQHFRCHARPAEDDAAVEGATGRLSRHLDAWLMPPEVCRDVFARGMRHADLAVVEGTLDEPSRPSCALGSSGPGRLGPVAACLDLAVVGVVDCRREPIHLPHLNPAVEAVLLDGVRSPSHFAACRRLVRCLSGLPVLGGVEGTGGVPADELSEEAVERLGRAFLDTLDTGVLAALAAARPGLDPQPQEPHTPLGPLRVAYAQDEAFGVDDPDAIDRLEALGATLVEFSPLRSERLPRDVDVVVIGCGHPEQFADELAANVSLIAALRNHVCRGHRLYGEGGGAAYLGRSLVLPDRPPAPMAGILPFDAVLRPEPRRPAPVSRRLVRDSWLGAAGAQVKGYRSGRWRLEPAPVPEDCPACAGVLTAQHDLYFRHHAIGSLVHLPLAALPDVVDRFVRPHRPSIRLPSRSQPQTHH